MDYLFVNKQYRTGNVCSTDYVINYVILNDVGMQSKRSYRNGLYKIN